MPFADRMTAPVRCLRRAVASVSGAQLVALLLLVAVSGAMIVHQQTVVTSEARASAAQRAAASADELGRTFRTWRTELLVAAANPTLQEWYRRPHDRGRLRPVVDRGLLTLHSVDADLFDEVCLIDVDGQEQARQVRGESTPAADLSPDESVNPFFAPTLDLEATHVHRNAPYVSPDSHRWVISNSTPLYVDDKLEGIVHFEANLDRLRVQLAAVGAPDRVIQVVDPERGVVITDSRSTEPRGARPLLRTSQQRLPEGWQRASATLPSMPGNELQWRVDVLVRPDGIWGTALWLRLGALLVLGGATLLLLGLHSSIRRAGMVDART